MKNISQFISILFHPFFMVAFATAVFFLFIPSELSVFEGFYVFDILFIVLGFTFLGIVVLYAIVKLGKPEANLISFESMQGETKEDRQWPLLFSAIIYFLMYYCLNNLKVVPTFIYLFIVGAIIQTIVAGIINLTWKISLHMIGIGGLCGAFLFIMLFRDSGGAPILAACFFIAGLIGTARLYLQAHTPRQILAGFSISFLIQFSIFYFLLP